jgi:hypothetical protein
MACVLRAVLLWTRTARRPKCHGHGRCEEETVLREIDERGDRRCVESLQALGGKSGHRTGADLCPHGLVFVRWVLAQAIGYAGCEGERCRRLRYTAVPTVLTCCARGWAPARYPKMIPKTGVADSAKPPQGQIRFAIKRQNGSGYANPCVRTVADRGPAEKGLQRAAVKRRTDSRARPRLVARRGVDYGRIVVSRRMRRTASGRSGRSGPPIR